jgi:pimeloyl-ACP methyl ester carboxylesterase
MTRFAQSPDGLHIAYETLGQGVPVLLIHGFGSSRAQNWRATGWYEALVRGGFHLIAMDCRGHGDSDKPHDPAMYSYALMAGDALAVLRATGADQANIIGYSMGGHLGLEILMNHPEVLRRLVIAGVGETYLRAPFDHRFGIADALLEPDTSRITDPLQKAFRAFADQPGKDRVALAACMRGERRVYSADELAQATRPVLVVCGENDKISGAPGPVAAALPEGTALVVPGRDHMSAVGDKRTKEAALEFLAEASSD